MACTEARYRPRHPGAVFQVVPERFKERSPERTCKPGFVTLRLRNAGDHSSRTLVAQRLQQPTRESSRAGPAHALCLALHRVGFTKPIESPRLLVRSYRTFSPLPEGLSAVGYWLSKILPIAIS